MTKALFKYAKVQGKPRPDHTYRAWRRNSSRRARRAGRGHWEGVQPDREVRWPDLRPMISDRGEVWFAFAHRITKGLFQTSEPLQQRPLHKVSVQHRVSAKVMKTGR